MMTMRPTRLPLLFFLTIAWNTSTASGAVVITLQSSGVGTGGVAPGTQVPVDILLSVSDGSDPVTDVRVIQFNFRATSPGISLDNFTWLLTPTIDDSEYLLNRTFPQPMATYRLNSRREGMILDLDTQPLLVASMDVTVNGSGAIDMRFDDPDDITTGNITLIRAGFTTVQDFTFANRGLSGGRVTFSVVGGGPDQDRDGVPDNLDAFPTDPTETKDTDHDGVGDNADTDDDGDDVPDTEDLFPADPAESIDTDGDGIGNNADLDDDNDNVPDAQDAFPLDPTESNDSDGDGIGDNADPDSPDDRNTGPRATGGCGGAVTGSILLSLAVLGIVRFGSINRREESWMWTSDSQHRLCRYPSSHPPVSPLSKGGCKARYLSSATLLP